MEERLPQAKEKKVKTSITHTHTHTWTQTHTYTHRYTNRQRIYLSVCGCVEVARRPADAVWRESGQTAQCSRHADRRRRWSAGSNADPWLSHPASTLHTCKCCHHGNSHNVYNSLINHLRLQMSSPWKQPQCLKQFNQSLRPANVVTMETATMSTTV